jgi:hypothetical protein
VVEKDGFDLTPYREMVGKMLDEIGLTDADCYVPDGDYWELWKGSAKVYISFFSLEQEDGDEWYMDISSPVMKIPSFDLLAFYRRLLEENANRIALKFSVREDTVWCEITRELSGLSFEESYRNLIRVGEVADEVDDIFRDDFPVDAD